CPALGSMKTQLVLLFPVCQYHTCRTNGDNERLLNAIPDLIYLSTLSAQVFDNGILWTGGTGDDPYKFQGSRKSQAARREAFIRRRGLLERLGVEEIPFDNLVVICQR